MPIGESLDSHRKRRI